MPCVPSWHEQLWMREGDGILRAANALAKQVPLLEKTVPLVIETLEAKPALAQRPEAKAWPQRAEAALVAAERLKVFREQPMTFEEIDARVSGKDELAAVFRSVEQLLCEAGVLVHLSRGGTAPLPATAPPVTVDSRAHELLVHHREHRAADRDAKVEELQ